MLLALELLRKAGTKTEIVEASSALFDDTGGPLRNTTQQLDVPLLGGLPSALFSRSVDPGTIYATNPWLVAVVNLIARGWSRMPPKVYEIDGEGDKVRATSHLGVELERVLREPANGVSWTSLRRSTARDKLVYGNALWLVTTDPRSGSITEIDRLPWAHVVATIAGNEVLYQDARLGRQAPVWTSDNVIHFGFCEDDHPIAPSPVRSLRASLALWDAVQTHLLSYLGRSARPAGVFKVDPHLDETIMDEVTATIRDYFVGPQNAGRVLVTSAEWQPTSDSPGDSGLRELAQQSRQEICAVYAVSPPLVGILEQTLMNTVKELREHTTRDTVGPYAMELDETINAQLRQKWPRYRGLWTESDSSAALAGDIESRAASWPNQLRIRTPNELRAIENLKPLDDPAANLLWSPNSGDSATLEDGLSLNERATMLQKLYLGVGVAITVDEARRALREAGWDLDDSADLNPTTSTPQENP